MPIAGRANLLRVPRFERLRRALADRPSAGHRLRLRDLARLDHLLESSEIACHLLLRLLPEQLRGHDAERSGRRLVGELDADLGATVARRVDEVHAARVLDAG